MLGCLATTLFSFGVQAQNNIEFNRSFHRLFTGEELSQLQSDDVPRLEKINYYLTESFSVTLLDCDNCIVNSDELFNFDLFNVFDFESNRLPNSESTFIYKEKYAIQLKSFEELSEHIGDITPYELINGIPLREFPEWDSNSSLEQNYANYKAEIVQWSIDFPNEFRQKMNNSSLLKIRKEAFLELSEERKESLNLLPNGFVIVDEEILTLINKK